MIGQAIFIVTILIIAFIVVALGITGIFAWIADNTQTSLARSTGYMLNLFEPDDYKQKWYNAKLPIIRKAYLKGVAMRASHPDFEQMADEKLAKIEQAGDKETLKVYTDVQNSILMATQEKVTQRKEYFENEYANKYDDLPLEDNMDDSGIYEWKAEKPVQLSN